MSRFYLLILVLFISVSYQTSGPLDDLLDQTKDQRDPFEALGIPAFDLKLDQPVKQRKIKLNSIEDLPKFIESGQYNNEAGMKLITKFLSEDDQDLKNMGGVYDETGCDGVDDKEDCLPDGTTERQTQRARSVAMLYMKNGGTENTAYEPYGETVDKEKVDGWWTYQVLLMNPQGDHKLIKVCIPQRTDIVINFGMEETELCGDRVQTAYDLTEKGKAYYKKAGFEKFAPNYQKESEKVKIQTPPKQQIQVPPIPTPAPVQQVATPAQSTPEVESEEDKQIRELAEKMKQLQDQKQKKIDEQKKAQEQAAKQVQAVPVQSNEENLKNEVQNLKKQLDDLKALQQAPVQQPVNNEDKLKNEVSDLKKELEELKAAMKYQNKMPLDSRFKEVTQEDSQQMGYSNLINQRINQMKRK